MAASISIFDWKNLHQAMNILREVIKVS